MVETNRDARSTKAKSRRTAGRQADSDKDRRVRDGRVSELLLLEIAWETCNQLGGIYTVLRSKVPAMVQRWGNHYCLIGPYNPATAQVEFEPRPLIGSLGQATKQLRDMGIGAHYGRWLVTGRPRVVLLNYLDVFSRLDQIKYRLWDEHGIAVPAADELVNNTIAFGEVCRLLLMMLAQLVVPRQALIAHFHEWMAAVAVPMLRRENWAGTIVFTTHATMLGRYLAMHDPSFYDRLPHYDAQSESRRFNVEPQFLFERAAAHGAHVFTTVSDVTAAECEPLLGRAPDLLLPNGLNIERFAAIHEFQNMHRIYKEKIHEFVVGHFFPSYSFDLDKTLYFFTSGRYEYKNKGMDLTIEALARLNHRMQAAGSSVTVVAFIVTRAAVKSISVEALQTRAMLQEFGTIADGIKNQIGDRLLHEAATARIPDLNTLVDEYWLLRLRRTIHAWKRVAPPSIVTHDLVHDANDDVLNRLRGAHLCNQKHNPVKVIYHPDFINSTNPLFALEYDQFVRGCHLGVFPSYYEPWGYTPLEAIACGVPAVTSDLSGFGSYVIQLLPNYEQQGLYVLRRRHRSFEEAAHDLSEYMYGFTHMTRRERMVMRHNVENFSVHFDWHNLSKRYHEAHELGLDRINL